MLLPTAHAPLLEHEVASATGAGEGPEGNPDTVAIFALDIAHQNWSATVLAVADGNGWPSGGAMAGAIAVDALEDYLGAWADDLDFTTPAWQIPVAQALSSAFEQANANVRSLLDGAGGDPGQGVALTAAVLLDDWLCIAHAGDCRVYRFANQQLEQLTTDHTRPYVGRYEAAEPPVRSLGLAAHMIPVVSFLRLQSHDIVMVCNPGLHRQLGGAGLTRAIDPRQTATEIGASLIEAARARGGHDDISACVARLGRLRARPLQSPDAAPGAGRPAKEVLQPYHPESATRRRRAVRRRAFVGALVLATAAGGGAVAWRGQRMPTASATATHRVSVERPVMAPMVPQVPAAPAASVTDSVTIPVEAAGPSTERVTFLTRPVIDTPRTLAAVPAINDSAPSNARRDRDRRDREVKDSALAAWSIEDGRRTRDSLAGALRAAELVRSQVRERADSQARADQLAGEQREAQARAEQAIMARAAAAAVELQQRARAAAGRATLTNWLNGVVKSTNAGNAGAPVLAAGPPGFATFIRHNQPTLEGAQLVAITMTDTVGAATAEWVAKWRTQFGTATTRRMQATVTVVPDGDTWHLRDWHLTSGAP